ncbi:hypothetical protein VTN77DRAFT_9046 [Rasamsonia byssochlamydoides]|uniref:uncharacterized protein n=1 Tax=Rasamsonia byssochlamydoides TaxID=89139 RepID=UPI003741FC34
MSGSKARMSSWRNSEPSTSVRQSLDPAEDYASSFDDIPPPAYGEEGTIAISQDGIRTQAQITDDGRIDIYLNEKSGRLSNLFAPALQRQLENVRLEQQQDHRTRSHVPLDQPSPVSLNVVIHVVGSRGDVQPFVALGLVLKNTYRHRVRLATHPVFKEFVEKNGLEFFSIGGDPAELMAFMVKNPNLVPSMKAVTEGDISRRRQEISEILEGCWRSCIEPGNGLRKYTAGVYGSDDPSERPFLADAIIANPPSFAHIHIAEKLGIPLHIIFTMPWSPTTAFPHPMANIRSSNANPSTSNFVSYSLVEMMTWQGLGDLINRFRVKSLGLEPLSSLSATGVLNRLRIPVTYCWSPALIPKPEDWGPHISVTGFCFLGLASTYTPDPELAEFLAAGPPPIYIGFGSIVVDDPDGMTKLIFEAVAKTGQRALVSKGWGGFGASIEVPPNIFLIGNCPHDWLFQRVSCVVHHGGAGTTAAGIALDKPTVVVPFFGDQPFWGAMIKRAGAGPSPIPHKQLTADNLAEAILEALRPDVVERARELGKAIRAEDGARAAAHSFQDQLNIDQFRCSIFPSAKAVWKVKKSRMRLSALAATVLGNAGLLNMNNLRPVRIREYVTEEGAFDPISGGMGALLGSIGSLALGILDLPVQVASSIIEGNPEGGAAPAASGSVASASAASSASVRDGGSYDDRSSSHSRTSSLVDDPKGKKSRKEKKSTGKSFAYGFYKEVTGKETIATSKTGIAESSSPLASDQPRDSIASDAAKGAGKGMGRIVEVGLKTPLDFTMGIAKGFRNAPRLYGDDTVRQQDKITGFHSGVKTATKELGLGFYDGITGIVTQPIRGAKKDGVGGFFKGIGKGLGGAILKPGAAIWGIPAYSFKGVYEEVQKYFGSSLQSYIVATRYMEGHQSVQDSTEEQRQEIIKRWNERGNEPPDSLEKWKSAQERRKGGRREGSLSRPYPPGSAAAAASMAAASAAETTRRDSVQTSGSRPSSEVSISFHSTVRAEDDEDGGDQYSSLRSTFPSSAREKGGPPAYEPPPYEHVAAAPPSAPQPASAPAPLPALAVGSPALPVELPAELPGDLQAELPAAPPAPAASHSHPAVDDEEEEMIRRAIAESIESERLRAARFGVTPQV